MRKEIKEHIRKFHRQKEEWLEAVLKRNGISVSEVIRRDDIQVIEHQYDPTKYGIQIGDNKIYNDEWQK